MKRTAVLLMLVLASCTSASTVTSTSTVTVTASASPVNSQVCKDAVHGLAQVLDLYTDALGQFVQAGGGLGGDIAKAMAESTKGGRLLNNGILVKAQECLG